MDRISNLPDEIIIKILSFLSIDKAASTSILSKRWRDLFAFTPNLHLCYTTPGTKSLLGFMSYRQKFVDFVERVLDVSGNFPIRSFTLNSRLDVKKAHIDRWISNVLNRGGVLDLDLNVDRDFLDRDYLVSEVLACKTLVKLKLTNVGIPMLPEDASFPALKCLCLNLVEFVNLEAFEKLISACPLLEEFIHFQYGSEFLDGSHFLSGPTLQRLTTSCYNYKHVLGSKSFDHPNLVYLEYSGYLQRQYPIVNLGSLVEAKLNLVMGSGKSSNCDPSNLIKGLRNVKILSLSSFDTLGIFGIFHEPVPVFENLYHLSIEAAVKFCLLGSSLPSLMKKFPNLQTLVIKGPLCGYVDSKHGCPCFSENSCVMSSPVKVLELTKYAGSIKELEQIKRFLEELSCLELVKVSASAKDEKEKFRITTDLLKLPRASPRCRIQFQFS